MPEAGLGCVDVGEERAGRRRWRGPLGEGGDLEGDAGRAGQVALPAALRVVESLEGGGVAAVVSPDGGVGAVGEKGGGGAG